MTETIITSSVLIVIITAVRFLLRGKIGLRLQYALWALVALRLLLPFSLLPSPVSVMNMLPNQQIRHDVPLTYVPDSPILSPSAAVSSPSDELTPAGSPHGPAQALPVHTAVSLPTILTAIWLSGAVLFLGVVAALNLRTRFKLNRSAVRVEASCRLPVYRCAWLPSPCLFGLFQPRIYLTPDSFSSEENLRFILIHEMTHYRHGDHLWAYIRCLCLALYWFNPLVWLAAILSRRDCELACDEGTLARLGETNRITYGRMLVSMMSDRRTPSTLLSGATSMTTGKSSLKERITMIASSPKTFAPALLLVVFIILVAVGCTFTGANTPQPETSPSVSPSASPSAEASASPFDEEGALSAFETLLQSPGQEIKALSEMRRLVPALSPDHASKMVLDFEAYQQAAVDQYNLVDEHLIGLIQADTTTSYNEKILNDPSQINNTDLKNALQALLDRGYQIIIPEGMYQAIINYNAYADFKPYLTQDIAAYIDIRSQESQSRSLEDAAIIIPVDDILSRALASERFLQTYPSSVKRDDVKLMHDSYVTSYILGQNNTPAFDYETNKLSDEFRRSYEGAIKNGGDSALLKALPDYMDILKKSGFKLTDSVKEYRTKMLDGLLA